MNRTTSQVLVWDRFVRLLHWALVVTFAAAYGYTEPTGLVHQGAGCLALGLVSARTVWGFIATRPYARYENFVPSPNRLWHYLHRLVRRREPRHLGLNPVGAVTVLFLLCGTVLIGVTGFLITTEAYRGNERIGTLHVCAVDATLIAVFLHIATALYGSFRQRENLFTAMLTGYKRDYGKPAATHDGPRETHRQTTSNKA